MAKRQQHYSKLSGMLASLPTSTKANSMTPRGSKPECGFTQERSVFDLSRPSSSNKLSDMGKKSQSQYQWQQKNVLLESQFNSQLLSQPQTIGDKSNSESKRTFKTRGAGLSSQRLSNSMLLSKDLPPRSISKEKDSALKILYGTQEPLINSEIANRLSSKIGSASQKTITTTPGLEKRMNDSNSMPLSSVLGLMRSEDKQQRESFQEERLTLKREMFDKMDQQLKATDEQFNRIRESVKHEIQNLNQTEILETLWELKRKVDETSKEILRVGTVVNDTRELHEKQFSELKGQIISTTRNEDTFMKKILPRSRSRVIDASINEEHEMKTTKRTKRNAKRSLSHYTTSRHENATTVNSNLSETEELTEGIVISNMKRRQKRLVALNKIQ